MDKLATQPKVKANSPLSVFSKNTARTPQQLLSNRREKWIAIAKRRDAATNTGQLLGAGAFGLGLMGGPIGWLLLGVGAATYAQATITQSLRRKRWMPLPHLDVGLLSLVKFGATLTNQEAPINTDGPKFDGYMDNLTDIEKVDFLLCSYPDPKLLFKLWNATCQDVGFDETDPDDVKHGSITAKAWNIMVERVARAHEIASTPLCHSTLAHGSLADKSAKVTTFVLDSSYDDAEVWLALNTVYRGEEEVAAMLEAAEDLDTEEIIEADYVDNLDSEKELSAEDYMASLQTEEDDSSDDNLLDDLDELSEPEEIYEEEEAEEPTLYENTYIHLKDDRFFQANILEAFHLSVLGGTGSGKSTFCVNLARLLRSRVDLSYTLRLIDGKPSDAWEPAYPYFQELAIGFEDALYATLDTLDSLQARQAARTRYLMRGRKGIPANVAKPQSTPLLVVIEELGGLMAKAEAKQNEYMPDPIISENANGEEVVRPAKPYHQQIPKAIRAGLKEAREDKIKLLFVDQGEGSGSQGLTYDDQRQTTMIFLGYQVVMAAIERSGKDARIRDKDLKARLKVEVEMLAKETEYFALVLPAKGSPFLVRLPAPLAWGEDLEELDAYQDNNWGPQYETDGDETASTKEVKSRPPLVLDASLENLCGDFPEMVKILTWMHAQEQGFTRRKLYDTGSLRSAWAAVMPWETDKGHKVDNLLDQLEQRGYLDIDAFSQDKPLYAWR